MSMTILIGVRVAGPATFVPCHQIGTNKPTRQMATFSVFENDGDKKNKYKITAFGKMADIVARSCATGKKLTLICSSNTYKGKVALNDAAGNVSFVLGHDGQPLLIEKTGYIIEKIDFGDDSDKQVAFEIQNQMRPALWNVNGHPDNVAWKNICAQRNAMTFAPGMTQFGYAVVKVPANATLVDPATLGGKTINSAGVGTAQYAGSPAAVANGFGGAQPVNVNGQNMGYAMPQYTPHVQTGQTGQTGQTVQNGYAQTATGFAGVRM